MTLAVVATLTLATPLDAKPDKPRVKISAATYDSRCASAWQAVRWYRARYNHHRATMGASLAPPVEQAMGCRRLRERAVYWRSAARANRAAAARWVETQYHWWKWLPDKFARVGACETGYGKRPGNWRWDSGTYVSAFGIYRPAYAQFAGYLGLPSWDDPGERTPREQYQVAAAIQARYGWSAWGCGGA